MSSRPPALRGLSHEANAAILRLNAEAASAITATTTTAAAVVKTPTTRPSTTTATSSSSSSSSTPTSRRASTTTRTPPPSRAVSSVHDTPVSTLVNPDVVLGKVDHTEDDDSLEAFSNRFVTSASTRLQSIKDSDAFVSPISVFDSKRQCSHEQIDVLYNSLNTLYRCYTVLFNRTTHPIDPFIVDYTYVAKAGEKPTKTSTASSYFLVKTVVNPYNEEDTYNPLDLGLPDIDDRFLELINIEMTADLDIVRESKAHIVMLFYVYMSMCLDIVAYIRLIGGNKSTIFSIFNGSLQAEFVSLKIAQAFNAMYNTLKDNDVDTIRLFVSEIDLYTRPYNPKAPHAWRALFKVDTGFVNVIANTVFNVMVVMPCYGLIKPLSDMVVATRNKINEYTKDPTMSTYLTGIQEFATRTLIYIGADLLVDKSSSSKLTGVIATTLTDIANSINGRITSLEGKNRPSPEEANVYTAAVRNFIKKIGERPDVLDYSKWWKEKPTGPTLRSSLAQIILDYPRLRDSLNRQLYDTIQAQKTQAIGTKKATPIDDSMFRQEIRIRLINTTVEQLQQIATPDDD